MTFRQIIFVKFNIQNLITERENRVPKFLVLGLLAELERRPALWSYLMNDATRNGALFQTDAKKLCSLK